MMGPVWEGKEASRTVGETISGLIDTAIIYYLTIECMSWGVEALTELGLISGHDIEKMQAVRYGKSLKIDDQQFGKKVGKHAEDFGLNPKNPQDRNWVRGHIENIHKNYEELRIGQWRGLGEGGRNGNFLSTGKRCSCNSVGWNLCYHLKRWGNK